MIDTTHCDCGPGSIVDGKPTRCICGKPPPLDLSAIEAAAKAATPGPWIAHKWNHLADRPPRVDMGHGGRCCQFIGPVSARDEDAIFIALCSPSTILALVERVRIAEVALGDAWELTNKADAALCEIISEGQRTFEIPSSPAWRDTPIGKARLLVTEADDTLRAALRALVPR